MSARTDTTRESRKQKEVTVVRDEGFFQHNTGDTYNGSFEARKKDRSVKMSGPGVYTTVDGEIYTGTWEADKLGANQEVTITFPDGSSYQGSLKDWRYSGPAKYNYPDSSVLECNFVDNCPVGNLKLTDPNSHIWLGSGNQGFGWLQPQNHYYDILEKVSPSNKLRPSRKDKEENSESKSPKGRRSYKVNKSTSLIKKK